MMKAETKTKTKTKREGGKERETGKMGDQQIEK